MFKEEEQDIHTRADLYAITAVPDSDFLLLPEQDDHSFLPTVPGDEFASDSSLGPPRKKRRRNYGNSTCFVSHHNHEDIFDNTKMLPIGKKNVFIRDNCV